MAEAKDRAPAWRVIADALRSEIADEVYPPGGPLPGESQLAERHGVSRPTVRRAITVLVGEGLLTAAHGRGTFVRPRPDRRVILINSPEPFDLLADDHNPTPHGWLPWEHAKAEEIRRHGADAPEGVLTAAGRNEAEALGVRAGTLALYRYRNWRHAALHQTVAVMSVIPAHLLGVLNGHPAVGAADLEEAEQPDDPAAHGRPEYEALAERGPVRFICTVTARMPVGEEVGDLDVPTGTAVIEARRVMTDAHGRPLELTTVTAPADRFEVASAPEWLSAAQATGDTSAAVLRL